MLNKRFEFAKALVAVPPSLGPTFLKMDIAHALTAKMLSFIFIFLFMLTFDAIGTLIGVCELAGFMRDNKLPRAKQAMVSDAIGTVTGATLGEHSHEFYRERGWRGGRRANSADRPGCRCSFLFALFFIPLIAMIGGYPPITAPALTIVGAMMMQNVTKGSLDGLH